MKKNNSVLLSTPYIIWMIVFTLIPLGVVGYYALTDPATGAFTLGNIRNLNLYWGVQLINGRIWDDEHDSAAAAVAAALREGYVEIGDTTVITSGISSGEAGFKSKGNNTTKIQIAVVD